jgi:hypothetical protein
MNEVLPTVAGNVSTGATLISGELVSLILDECEYVLNAYVCSNCGHTHYRVCRFAGAFYSAYLPPDDFEPAGFEDFVRDIHETMSLDARPILADVRGLLNECNSRWGIETDGSYLSQLQDFARLRLKLLRGPLSRIEGEGPMKAQDKLILAAFELGFAASELRLKDGYEDAIFEGWRLQEGREHGREAAAVAKAKQTKTTRAAIKTAARALHADDPELARNDAATARVIASMHLPALCRHGQTSIGSAAIVKHLRALHKAREL